MGIFKKKVEPQSSNSLYLPKKSVQEVKLMVPVPKMQSMSYLSAPKQAIGGRQKSMHDTGKPPDLLKPIKNSSSDSDDLEKAQGADGNSKSMPKRKVVEKTIRKTCTSWWIRFSCLFLSPIFLRHRNKFFIFIEVVVPACITLAICAAFTHGISWRKAHEAKVRIENSPDPKLTEMGMEKPMEYFRAEYLDSAGHLMLLFAPCNNLTQEIMKDALEILKIDEKNKIDETGKKSTGAICLPNELEVLEMAIYHRNETHRRHKGHKNPIGVIFLYDKNSTEQDKKFPIPKIMSFSIRTFDPTISKTEDDFPYVEPKKGEDPSYIKSGFVGLQHAIQWSYFRKFQKAKRDAKPVESVDIMGDLFGNEGTPEAEEINEESDAPELKLKMFDSPNFYNEEIRALISTVVTICLVIAYLFTSFFIVKQMVYEHKSGIREILRMHGMPVYLHWIILFCHALFFRAITAALIMVFLFMDYGLGMIFSGNSSQSLVFLILWGHLLALTSFNFFMATVVRSTSMVGVYTTLIGLLSFVLPWSFHKYNLIKYYTNIFLVAVFPNWGLFNVISVMVDFECDEKGVQWNSTKRIAHKSVKMSNNMPIRDTMLIIVASGLVYFIAAIYDDLTTQVKLYPPAFAWWDCWGKNKQRIENKKHHDQLLNDIKEGCEQTFDRPAVFEESANKKCFVHIRNLCKRYGKHKIAIDTLNLDIMHEEITVILGHSGCGKSTIISILAGMLPPTTGYATVKDHDVSYESSKARHYTGLCTQKLIYFNLLTVKQHVFLCYRLRGYNKEDCNRHSSTLLTRLRLWNVRSFYPENMTNDELRRLGIAMAMADAPRVLLLDEPTAGMDAMGRREIWTILKALKKHHTIILTTNYMDEAEYLGDRVALVAYGRLICFGSVDFLRSQYDTGYFIKLMPMPTVTRLDSNVIMGMLRARFGQHVQEKTNKSRKEVDNLIIELPQNQLQKFADMCDDLDKNMMKLGIKKYTIKRVGLGDIFIKICESIASDKNAPDLYVRRDSAGDIRSALTSQIPTLPKSVKFRPKWNHQISALLKKRWAYMRTKNDFFVWEYIIPFCLIVMVVLESTAFVTAPVKNKPRNLTYSAFPGVVSVFVKTAKTFSVNYPAHIADILQSTGAVMKVVPSKDRIHNLIKDLLNSIAAKGYVKEEYMTAMELSGDKGHSGYDLIGYYASGAMHSSPIILNTMINVILRASKIPKKDEMPYKLYCQNDPFPVDFNAGVSKDGRCLLLCSIFAIMLSFAYSFISASAVSFPMRERLNGMKQIQLMTGVSPSIYWLADYLCDVMTLLCITFLIGMIFVFQPTRAFEGDGAHAIFVFLVFTVIYFVWAGLAFSYFMSTMLPVKCKGFNFMIVFHFVFCLFPFLWLELAFADTTRSFIIFLRYTFMILPGYAVTCSIQDWFDRVAKRSKCHTLLPSIAEFCDIGGIIHSSHVLHPGHSTSEDHMYEMIMKHDKRFGECCERICKPQNKCYELPGVLGLESATWSNLPLLADILILLLQGAAYWGLLVLVERRIFNRLGQRMVANFLISSAKKRETSKLLHEPKDVKHEAEIVNAFLKEKSFPSDVAMVISDLTKSHTTAMIINKFNLEVKKGDCVAILGAGASGKSTLLRIISGAILPTTGMCYIGKSSLVTNRKDYLASIGYCAQENALFKNFTGIQMLELMGRLRGIPAQLLSSHVAKWLLVMGLGDAAKHRCKTYGPGMQRRLCCAMALIGNPPILLLDEATSGVDPLARERFWAILEHLKETGHTIIFTSFHTEESLNLASKMVILGEGNVQCMGTPEDLQNKFTKGHCLTFRLRHDILTPIEINSVVMGRVVEFKKAIEGIFLFCDLIDEQDNLLMYFLRDITIRWGDVFRKTENICQQFSGIIESYDISESSIEDLFILLTNKYRELENPRRSEPMSPYDASKLEVETKALEQTAKNYRLQVS